MFYCICIFTVRQIIEGSDYTGVALKGLTVHLLSTGVNFCPSLLAGAVKFVAHVYRSNIFPACSFTHERSILKRYSPGKFGLTESSSSFTMIRYELV